MRGVVVLAGAALFGCSNSDIGSWKSCSTTEACDTGGATTSGGTSSNTGGILDSGAKSCVETAVISDTLASTDVFVALDQSSHMSEVAGGGAYTRWQFATSLLSGLVRSPILSPSNVGVVYFPAPPSGLEVCEYGYDLADIPIAPSAENATKLDASLALHSPAGLAETSRALEGAIDALKVWAKDRPDRSLAALLVVGGLPEACANMDSSNLTAAALRGMAARPYVRTFVYGVGTASIMADLDEVALAGGTKVAFSPEREARYPGLQSALEIANPSDVCAFDVPVVPSGKADPESIRVRYSAGAERTYELKQVAGASDCSWDQDPGFYVDVQSEPKRVILCSQLCWTAGGGEFVISACDGQDSRD